MADLYVYDWDYDSNSTVARYAYLGAGKGYNALDFTGTLNNLSSGKDIIAWAWGRIVPQQDGTGGYGRTNRSCLFSITDDSNRDYNAAQTALAFGVIASSSSTNNMGFWATRGMSTSARIERTDLVGGQYSEVTVNPRNKNWFVGYWWDDDAGEIHIFYANDSDDIRITEATLVNEAAGSGTAATTAVRLALGNTTALGRTWDGPIFRAGMIETTGATSQEVEDFFTNYIISDTPPDWSTLSGVTLGTSPSTYVAYYGGGSSASGGATTNKLASVPGNTVLSWEDDGPNGWDLYSDDTTTDDWQVGPWGSSRADDTGHTQPLTVDFPAPPIATLTKPQQYSVWQRALPSGSVNVKISGTIEQAVPSGEYFQARFKYLGDGSTTSGDSWTNVSAQGPLSAGTTFTDVNISASGPRRELEFRMSGDSPVDTDDFHTAVGDMLLLIGQSNMECLGGNGGAVTTGVPEDFGGNWVGHFYSGAAADGTHSWDKMGELPNDPGEVDSNDPSQDVSATQDNIWPRTFGELMQSTDVPIGFVMVSKGNHGIGCFRRGYYEDTPSGGQGTDVDTTWTTTWNSGDLTAFYEEIIQRTQQILGLSNGSTPDYYGASPPTECVGVFRAALVHDGEYDAVAAVTRSTWKSRLQEVVTAFEENLGITEVVVGQIGKYGYVTWDALHEIRQAQQESWTEIDNVLRGPTTYHLNITADGSTDVHFNTTDGTLTPYSKLWTLAIYDALYASNADEHRGLVVQSFTITSATTADLNFAETLNSEGNTTFNGIRVYVNGTLKDAVTTIVDNTDRVITQSGSKLTITIHSSYDLTASDVLTIDIGYRNASSGGEQLPHKTVSLTGTGSVDLPPETVIGLQATTSSATDNAVFFGSNF